MLFLELKRSELVVLHSRRHGVVRHGRWRLGLGEIGGDSCIAGAVCVVRLAVHLVVLCDAPLSCLSADQSPAHGACHDSTCNNDDGGRQHDPSSPSHVRYEEQDVDEEGQQRNQKSGEGKDEQRKQVAWRVGGRVEVSGDGEPKADQRHEGCDGVHNKDRGEGVARACGQREVGVRLVLEQCLCTSRSIAALEREGSDSVPVS